MTSVPASSSSAGDPAPADERRRAGKALRKQVPRSSHAAWDPPTDRTDPVEILTAQERTRVPELIPLRHARMLASPSTFYRGTAAVMAADLAGTPTAQLRTQACGDAHLLNFGLFATPERNLVFDVNDFDETLPAPFEWDLKRLAASLAVCARDNAFSDTRAAAAARDAVRAYRETIRNLACQTNLEVWYAKIDAEAVVPLLPSKRARKRIAKARGRTNLQALDKLTAVIDGRRRIVDDPPLIEHLEAPDLAQRLAERFAEYKETVPDELQTLLGRYRGADWARKVVGVGSVGTDSSILLLLGDDDDDPLFLQIKEADTSVLEPYAGKSRYEHQGQRVVRGQRLMQEASDVFLGWVTLDGRDAYVRQLRDMKGSANTETMNHKQLVRYGKLCAMALARAHARSGDAQAIGAYLGNGEVFDRALGEFALAYADQTERDYDEMVEAARSGRIEARGDA